MNKFNFKSLQVALITCLSVYSSGSLAGGFQLWEQNVTNVENFHAGRAVLAPDASIAYDNPAGIVRIQNQQMVVGATTLMTNVKYNGSVSNCIGTTCLFATQGTVQAGSFTLIPNFHYVAPLSPNLGFGVSVVAPFGSDVEYGRGTMLENMITRARLQVTDIAPGLGFNINKKLSLGLGIDIQKMSAEFDSIVLGYPSVTKGYDTAYGYHLGAIYQFNEASRLGVAYHSKVSHHIKGTSNWIGAGPNVIGNPNPTRDLANISLPPDTTVSLYQRLNTHWAVMGSAIYSQWNVDHNLVMQNIAGLGGRPVDNPLNFRNTWTFSLGADYYATDKLVLRAGAGYDQSPTRNAYRNLFLPDNDRYDLSVGGHYQVMKALGIDLGWTHVFMKDASINPPLRPVALFPIQPSTRGTSKTSADIVGAQITWDFI